MVDAPVVEYDEDSHTVTVNTRLLDWLFDCVEGRFACTDSLAVCWDDCAVAFESRMHCLLHELLREVCIAKEGDRSAGMAKVHRFLGYAGTLMTRPLSLRQLRERCQRAT